MKKLFRKLALIMSTVTLGLCVVFGFIGCANDTLVVYTEAGFAPFEYIKDGKIVGVDVDIMELVGKKLGKKVKFENVGFDTIIDSVSAGKLCNVGAAGISVTDERKEKVDFSSEYYTAKLYVIFKESEANSYLSMTTDGINGVYWKAMAGKKIAVQSGTTADLFLGDELGEEGTLYNTDAKKTGFSELAVAAEDVKAGNSDVLIIDELPAQKLAENIPTLKCAPLYYYGGLDENSQRVDDEVAQDVYAICVTKGKDSILKAINEVLEELGEDGINQLVQKHLGV